MSEESARLLLPEGIYDAKFLGFNEPKELLSKPWMYRLPLRLDVNGTLLIHHYFGGYEPMSLLRRLEKYHPKKIKVRVEHRTYEKEVFHDVRVVLGNSKVELDAQSS